MTSYTRMGESPGARQWLAEATRLVHRAEAALLAVAMTADSDVAESEGPRLSSEMAEAARDCRGAVELMLDLRGASGFATSQDLRQFWRDVGVSTRT